MERASKFSINELHEGMHFSFDYVLTEDAIDAFAKFSGDISPIHMDADFAKSRGFKGRVAHGAIFNALFSRFIGMCCPGESAILHSLNAKFHKPTYAGEKIVVSGEIDHVSDENKTILMTLTALHEPDGEVRVKAKAQVGLLGE